MNMAEIADLCMCRELLEVAESSGGGRSPPRAEPPSALLAGGGGEAAPMDVDGEEQGVGGALLWLRSAM